LAQHTIEQDWSGHTEEEHAIWRYLFERQQRLLAGRACREYLDGLKGLGVAAGGIPEFERLSDILDSATGWRIVAVPGLVPDDVFFGFLARRRFPSTCFIRRRDQLDYLQEPDVFHDRYQETYFVIDDFDELFAATRADFAPIYRELDALPQIAPDEMLPGDREFRWSEQKERAVLSTARV